MINTSADNSAHQLSVPVPSDLVLPPTYTSTRTNTSNRNDGDGNESTAASTGTGLSSITQRPVERYHGVSFYPAAHFVRQLLDETDDYEGTSNNLPSSVEEHRQHLDRMREALQRAAPTTTTTTVTATPPVHHQLLEGHATEDLRKATDDATASTSGSSSCFSRSATTSIRDDTTAVFDKVVAALQATGALPRPLQEKEESSIPTTETKVDQILSDFQSQLDLLKEYSKESTGIDVPKVANLQVGPADGPNTELLEPWPEEVDDVSVSSDRQHLHGYEPDRIEQDRVLMEALIKAQEQPNPVTPSKAIDLDETTGDPVLIQRYRIVESVWEHMNAHHPRAIRALCTDDFVAYVMGPDRQVQMALTLDQLQAQSIFEALPDFKFMYRSIRESLVEPGVMVVHDFVGTGTHTGDPFGFGPFPPLMASGQRVVLDPSESHYHFDPETNLICHEEIIALGEITGPPGVYQQLGGVLGPLPDHGHGGSSTGGRYGTTVTSYKKYKMKV